MYFIFKLYDVGNITIPTHGKIFTNPWQNQNNMVKQGYVFTENMTFLFLLY